MERQRRQPAPWPHFLPLVAAALLLAGAPMGPASGQGRVAKVALPAEISTDEREVPYRVAGSTATELRRSMLSGGPKEDGGAWYGYTTWHVRWRYDYVPVSEGCRIQEVDVNFRSRVRLPRWDPPDEADAQLVSEWRAFVAALREHEYGHRDIGARAARDILRRLRSLRLDRCDGMEDRASTLAHRILERYREREDGYDRRTNHGEQQGAVWPPE